MNKTYSVIIAEDDAVVASGVKQILEASGQHVLAVVSNAEEVISMTTQLRPDVLILDLELNATDGIEAARVLMTTCPTPIVVCTAYADADLFIRAAEAGVSAYLVKPFKLIELMASIILSHERFKHWCCDSQKNAGSSNNVEYQTSKRRKAA